MHPTRRRTTFLHCSGRPERRSRRRHPQEQQGRLLLNLRVSSKTKVRINRIINGLPQLAGGPICIRNRTQLRALRGKLIWRASKRGKPVYAAVFVRRREIILETDLFNQPQLFRLILIHEIFHFVWQRLGNDQRAQFYELLAKEQEAHARGELGESAGVAKELVTASDRRRGSGGWRNYVCESFCDTAAWLYGGVVRHDAFTLAELWKRKRARWFRSVFESGCRC